MNYVMGFLLVLAAFVGFNAVIMMHNERMEFMADCQKFHPKYECTALWRGKS